MKTEELSKTHASFLSKLKERKFREENQLFVAQGLKCVRDLLENFIPFEIIIQKGFYPEDLNLASYTVKEATPSQMKQISTLTSVPSIIAVFKMPESDEGGLDLGGYNIFVDGVQDPGNMGTIIRTADWFGFHKLYVSKDSADIYNPKTVQATMGSLTRVKVFRSDLENLIENNKELPVIGLVLNGKDIFKTKLPGRGIVILGNEGKGISENLLKKITLPLLIPPYDDNSHSESLNVGVACGITLAELRNR